MNINPEVIVTPDRPTVVIREPEAKVDLDLLIPRILTAQGWGLGTYFDVHFISHDRGTLFKRASFVVTGIASRLVTNEADMYHPITKNVTTREYRQIGDWDVYQETAAPELTQGPAPEPGGETFAPPGSTTHWHAGKMKFEILDPNGACIAELAPGSKEPAELMAAGTMPLPEPKRVEAA